MKSACRFNLRSLCFLLFAFALLSWSRLPAQSDPAAAIAPLLDEQTLLVGRVNLRKIDAAAAVKLRGVFRLEATDSRSNLAIIGSQRAIERMRHQRPAARPEFAKGFERAGDTAAQFVFSPSEDTRRVLREMLPRLPDQVGGG